MHSGNTHSLVAWRPLVHQPEAFMQCRQSRAIFGGETFFLVEGSWVLLPITPLRVPYHTRLTTKTFLSASMQAHTARHVDTD